MLSLIYLYLLEVLLCKGMTDSCMQKDIYGISQIFHIGIECILVVILIVEAMILIDLLLILDGSVIFFVPPCHNILTRWMLRLFFHFILFEP